MDVDFSVLFPVHENIPYSEEKLESMFRSILEQSHTPGLIIILNCQRDNQLATHLHELAEEKTIECDVVNAQDKFLESCNQGLDRIKSPYYVFVNNDTPPVYFHKSAFELFRWAAIRNSCTGLFYSDYELVEPSGIRNDVHLLPFHPGRVRDNMDYGKVFVINTEIAEKIGGFSTQYENGYLYDFRLKVSELSDLTLISNRYHGSLYSVEEVGKGHNVFDYLMSGKDVQLEMEQIVSEHLKRIGAYLAPGGYQHEIKYAAEEEQQFQDCIASVVIPVNNRPEFIGTAIESVLQQTVKNVEVIVVVNGGEQDPTVKAVQEYQEGGNKYSPDLPAVRMVVHDINNIGLCLNEGLKAARGKFYVQLDSDDRLKPFAIEKLIEMFDSDPHIGIVIGSYEVWQKEEEGNYVRREDIPVVTHDEWTEENGRNNLLRINGAGAPRSAHIKVLREMGWFSVNDIPYSRNYGEDYEMVLKVSERYRVGRIWEPIYEVVRHAGGTDHAIDQQTVIRNDNAKDHMRLKAIQRRQQLNREREKI